MAKAWNKGKTKATDLSVMKISETMKRRKIDNFAEWRKVQSKTKPSARTKLKRNGDLAELIGVILGDGYIGQHPRTQVLRIVSNSNNPQFVTRYTKLVERVFSKKPSVTKRKSSNCVDIVLYQKEIAQRLGLVAGRKTHRTITLPKWIENSRQYKIRFLRGLYETDGCLAHHRGTYTHKFTFSNVNQSLLRIVFMLLCELGFHPSKTKTNIQISRKAEVARASTLVKFREY